MSRFIKVIKQKRTQYNAPVGLIKQDKSTENALKGVAQMSYQVARLGFQEMAKQSFDVGQERAMSVPLERLTTLDEKGNYKVYSSNEFLSLGSTGQRAFKELMDKRIFKHWESDLTSKALEIRNKNALTPNGGVGFRESFGAYADTVIENLPDKYKGNIEQFAVNLADKHGSDLDFLSIQRRQQSNLASLEDDKAIFAHKAFSAVENKNFDLVESTIESMAEDLLNTAKNLERSSESAQLNKTEEKARDFVEEIVGMAKVNKMFDSTNMDTLDVKNVKLCLMYDTNCDKVPTDSGLRTMMSDIKSDLTGDNKEAILKHLVGISSAKEGQLSAIESSTGSSTRQENATERNTQLKNFYQIIDNAKETGSFLNPNFLKDTIQKLSDFINETNEEGNLVNYHLNRNDRNTAENNIKNFILSNVTPVLANLYFEDSNQIVNARRFLEDGDERNLNVETVRISDGKRIRIGEDEKRILKQIRKLYLNPSDHLQFLGTTRLNSLITTLGRKENSLKGDELQLKARLDELETDTARKEATREFFRVRDKSTEVENKIMELLINDKQEEAKQLRDDHIEFLRKIAEGKYSQVTGTIVNRYEESVNEVFNDNIKDKILNILTREANAEPIVTRIDGELRINDTRLDGFQHVLDYIRAPTDKTAESKVNPEIVTLLKNSTITTNPNQVSGFTTDINIRRQGLSEASSNTSQAEKALNLADSITNNTAPAGVETSKMVDDMAYRLLLGDDSINVDANMSREQVLQQWWLSEDSSNIGSRTFQFMFNSLANGYFPISFKQALIKAHQKRGTELENMMKAVHILTAFPQVTGKRVDIFSSFRTNQGGADQYGFSDPAVINRVNQLRSALEVAKYRGVIKEQYVDTTTNLQELGDTDVGQVRLNFHNEPDNNLEQIVQQITSVSPMQLKEDLNILADRLDMDSLPYRKEGEPQRYKVDTIIQAMLVDKGIIKGGNKAPKEIMELSKWLVKGMILSGEQSASDIYEVAFERVKHHVQNHFQKSESVIDFSDVGNFGVNLTRNNVSKHFPEKKMYAETVSIINENLPTTDDGKPMFHFAPESLDPEMLSLIFSDNTHNIEEGRSSSMWLNAFAFQGMLGGVPSVTNQNIQSKVTATAMVKELRKTTTPIVLVAYPSPTNNPMWQTYAMIDGALQPIPTKDGTLGLYTKSALIEELANRGIVNSVYDDLRRDAENERERLNLPVFRLEDNLP
jgi:hypothetical protein